MSIIKIGDDCLYHVLSFLDWRELGRVCQSLSSVKRQQWTNFLWKSQCIRKWNWRDELVLPNAGNTDTDWMRLFPTTWPMCNGIDLSSAPDVELTTDLSVEFHAEVGVTNRSVKGLSAFPTVIASDGEVISLTDLFNNSFLTVMIRTFHALLSWATTTVQRKTPPTSYSIPFYDSPHTLWIAARKLVYFEISVSRPSQDFSVPKDSAAAEVEECVAIGLATDDFGTGILPGWDQGSYGYHGDDGAIFHGSGQMLRHFGPVFGVGDTVGCGLNLETRSVFFTLNGEMLGVAFTNVTGSFYPAVGVDANVKIDFNFGGSPFVFSLGDILASTQETA